MSAAGAGHASRRVWLSHGSTVATGGVLVTDGCPGHGARTRHWDVPAFPAAGGRRARTLGGGRTLE
ncbi:hypothetical protein SALBM217S_05505 [Streptomyces griseoloalbus]